MANLTGNEDADLQIAGAVLVRKGLMTPADFRRSVAADLAGKSPEEIAEIVKALKRPLA